MRKMRKTGAAGLNRGKDRREEEKRAAFFKDMEVAGGNPWYMGHRGSRDIPWCFGLPGWDDILFQYERKEGDKP